MCKYMVLHTIYRHVYMYVYIYDSWDLMGRQNLYYTKTFEVITNLQFLKIILILLLLML